MVGVATLAWLIWDIINILEYSMGRTNLLVERLILMASKASGAMLKPAY